MAQLILFLHCGWKIARETFSSRFSAHFHWTIVVKSSDPVLSLSERWGYWDTKLQWFPLEFVLFEQVGQVLSLSNETWSVDLQVSASKSRVILVVRPNPQRDALGLCSACHSGRLIGFLDGRMAGQFPSTSAPGWWFPCVLACLERGWLDEVKRWSSLLERPSWMGDGQCLTLPPVD